MFMQPRAFAFLISAILIAVWPTEHRSSAWQENWFIQQTCLETTTPPANWSFDGTIIMRGNYGIHAYKREWETPHVVVFLDPDKSLRGGALSPDGNWYAYPWGDLVITASYNAITTLQELRVHSTHNAIEYIIPVSGETYHGAYFQAHWIDTEHILFDNWRPPYSGPVLVNPFTGNMESWNAYEDAVEFVFPYIYPTSDWAAFVAPYITNSPSREWIWGLFAKKDDTFERLSNPLLGEAYLHPAMMAWSPDNSVFAAQTANTIALFSREGTIIDTIYTFNEADYTYVAPDSVHWSLGGRYITFVLSKDNSWMASTRTWPNYAQIDYGENRLFIIDTQEHSIYDTCLEVGWGLAWSSNADQLALIRAGAGQAPLQILDMETMQLYTVAYHNTDYTLIGNDPQIILGWRED